MTTNTVVDFEHHKQQHKQTQDVATSNALQKVMIDVDLVVAASIDQLIQHGMSNTTAHEYVITHLSDVVMAYDLEV